MSSKSVINFFFVFLIGLLIGVFGYLYVRDNKNKIVTEEPMHTENIITSEETSVEETVSDQKQAYAGLDNKMMKTIIVSPEKIQPFLENRRELLMLVQEINAIPYANPNNGAFLGFKAIFKTQGGFAESVGFKTNDVLLEINGKRISSINSLVETYYKFRDSQPLVNEVKVLVYRVD